MDRITTFLDWSPLPEWQEAARHIEADSPYRIPTLSPADIRGRTGVNIRKPYVLRSFFTIIAVGEETLQWGTGLSPGSLAALAGITEAEQANLQLGIVETWAALVLRLARYAPWRARRGDGFIQRVLVTEPPAEAYPWSLLAPTASELEYYHEWQKLRTPLMAAHHVATSDQVQAATTDFNLQAPLPAFLALAANRLFADMLAQITTHPTRAVDQDKLAMFQAVIACTLYEALPPSYRST